MDRTIRGLVAGIIAGVMMDIWNLTDFYFFHITKLRFLDWVSVLLTWDKPKTGFATVFCLLVHILWDGLLGAIFANLLTSITSNHLFIKSTIYSIMLWFVFKTMVNCLRVPFLSGIQPVPGAMSNVLAVILWGITLGFMLKKLDPAKQ